MALFGGKRDGTSDVSADQAPPRPAQAAAEAARPQSQTRSVEGNVANIGKSISIKGDLTGNEDMVIEGNVEGKVDLPTAELTIGQNGKVRATLNAKSVIVVGRVEGDVIGAERVEIQGTGVVDGDVTAPKLIVAEGAVLNGAINMVKKEGAASPPKPPQPGPEVRKAG